MKDYFAFASDGWFPAIGYDSGNITIATTVDGGRNINNNFIGQVLGDPKYKYGINFKALSPADMKELLRRLDHTKGGSFVNDFYVHDPASGGIVRKTMYVGDRTGKPFRVHPGGQPELWLNVVANLIEV